MSEKTDLPGKESKVERGGFMEPLGSGLTYSSGQRLLGRCDLEGKICLAARARWSVKGPEP